MNKGKKNNNGLKNSPIDKNKTIKNKKNNIFINFFIVAIVIVLAIVKGNNHNDGNEVKRNVDDNNIIEIGKYKEGEHFYVLKNRVDSQDIKKNKLNITEFFWFGCPHCKNLEPSITNWVENNKSEINITYTHPSLGHGWEEHAKVSQALNLAGLTKYHSQIMRNINNKDFRDPNNVAEILNKSEEEKFFKAYNRDDIGSLINKSNEYFKETGSKGVPTLLIENQIVSTPSQFKSNTSLINMLDYFKNNKRKIREKLREVN